MALALPLQRESISRALSLMRPDWLILPILPADVELALNRHCPDVVICTSVPPGIEADVPMWILLYPANSASSVVLRNGVRYEIPDLALSSVVETIEQAHN